MKFFRSPVRLLGAAALSFAFGAAHAAFTFSTVSTGGDARPAANAYSASANGPSAIDAFSDLSINAGPFGTSLNRSAGDLSYTVSTQLDLYTAQSPVIGGPALQADINSDTPLYGTLTFSNFAFANSTSQAYSFGASFYLAEASAFNAVGGTMRVKATDVNGLTQTFTFNQGVSNSAASLYFRLGSDVALQSVELIGPTPPSASNLNLYATVDNVVVSGVPLPAAGWLLMSGLGGLGLVKRRRA